jgi:hypothetical protein
METIIIKDNKLISNTGKDKTIKRALNQVLSFFNKGNISFKIVFLKKRSELNKIRGYKTKRWEVGGYYGDSTIFIFDKNVFDKVSDHPKKYYYSTLVHEIAHVYTEKILKFVYPIWLTEGIAYIIARQDKEITKYHKKDLKKAYSEKDWERETYYTSSCIFTKYLLEKFGKEKLIRLMGSLKIHEKRADFYKKFMKIFGEEFNKIYRKYQEMERSKRFKYYISGKLTWIM